MKPKNPPPEAPAPAAPVALAFVPVVLPSKGLLYGPNAVIKTPEMPGGTVQIRKMTIREDEILASSGGSPVTRLNKLIANTTKLPTGFDPDLLLTDDRVFLLLALRTHSYGPNYEVQFNCRFCRSANKQTVDVVQQLKEVPLSEDVIEPFEVKLPDAGVTVGLRMMRGVDDAEAIKSAKVSQARGTAGTPIQDQIRRLLVTIDGETSDPLVKLSLVQNLTASDLRLIRQATEKLDFGVDFEVTLTCNRCEQPNLMDMPFGTDFFRP